MGPSPSPRCQGRLPPILRAGHGSPHETEIPVTGPSATSINDKNSNTNARQVGQTSTEEVKKRDLRTELLAAEQEARNKKRKAEGLPPLPIDGPAAGDEEANKRRKLLQEALDLDRDDDDDDDEKEENKEGNGKDKDGEGNRYEASRARASSCLII